MSLIQRYTQKFASSQKRYTQASQLFPSGVTHDLRYLEPFPLYIDRAMGSHKWDIDGHEFVDYWSGHGSMLLGHSHPAVVQAVREQVEKMTHAGGNHEGEIVWGEWVRKLVPSAERVRFTGSGTEATLMALRLARMFTGRRKILKFAGHFHGWHDAVTPGSDAPYENLSVPGLPAEVAANTVVCTPNDLNQVEATLAEHAKANDGIAAVILEPTGGHWGAVPIRGAFLHGLRELTTKYGALLIFDEVITGFRVHPGGAQGYYGVQPDMTTLAKILAGGLPGGCLAGRADILASIEFRPGKPKMKHPGTYNANPLSAVAGIATLERIADGQLCNAANEVGRKLRNSLNALFAQQNWPWIAYIDFSMFRLLPNYDGPRPTPAEGNDDGLIPYGGDLNRLDGVSNPKFRHAFRQAMLLEGVDMPGLGGWITAVHTEADIQKTVDAVARSIEWLQQNPPI